MDDSFHDKLRAKLFPGYNGKDIDNLHQLIDGCVLELVQLLESKYLSTDTAYRPVDLASKFQHFTLDFISSLAFGMKLGDLESDSDALGYIDTTEKTVPFTMATCLMPAVIALIQSPKLKWLIPNAEGMVGIGSVIKLAHNAVDNRFGPEAEVKKDMLGSFVAHGLSQQEANGESIVQIIAGSDNSATAIRSTLLFVMTNPQVYSRFQSDIGELVAAGKISSPITDAEARDFPTCRPSSGKTYECILLPHAYSPRYHVAWVPWTVMRDTEVFGEDAGIFRPEHWTEAGEDRRKLMDQTVMLDFASGSRWECLGKNIAMIELNKAYVELLRRFDLALVDPTKPWHSVNAAFFIQQDFNVRVTRRFNPN